MNILKSIGYLLLWPFALLLQVIGKNGKKILIQRDQKVKKSVEFTPDGIHILNYLNEIEHQFAWSQVKDVTWDSLQDREIVFQLDNNKTYSLYKGRTLFWYGVLRQIPSGYSQFNYAHLNTFISQLEGCEFCGFISIHEKRCLCCFYIPWEYTKNTNNISKEEYIKNRQEKIKRDNKDIKDHSSIKFEPKSTLYSGFEKHPELSKTSRLII